MLGRTRVIFALAFVLAGFMPAAAAPSARGAMPPRATATVEVPYGGRFGVASSHLKLYDASSMERELGAAGKAGAAWVRCDFAWSDLEPLPGAWNLAGTDLAVQKAQERGVRVLGILGASPPWANGGNDWRYPPTDVDAWRGYVRTVASRYRGRVSAWEVWNEENIHAFWQPEPDAAAYVQLLAAAAAEIRDADPEATVVMGGVAGLDPDYLNACLAAGAAEYVDAVAYHPYAETLGFEGQTGQDLLRPKESLCRFIVDFVHWLVSQYTSRDLEVWITEVGWTTCAETPPGVDASTQASYMLRTLVNYAACDVDRVIWFNLRDTMLNDWDRYGLLDSGFNPKRSYFYYSAFEQVFGSAVAVDRQAVSFSCANPATLEAHCFRLAGGGLALAVWKSDDLADLLDFTVNDAAVTTLWEVDPLSGERREVRGASRDSAGRVRVTGLPVGKEPVIIEAGTAPSAPGRTCYFAEGYTGLGFQEYLCLGNTGEAPARAEITFFFAGGGEVTTVVDIPPESRTTVDVNGVVGPDRSVSARVCSRQDVVVERPMYFAYGEGWAGGHVTAGCREPATTFYFAEGYTGSGFEEWLCVLNPGNEPAELTLIFQSEEEGEKRVRGLAVGPRSRATYKVNDILEGALQVSCVVEASRPVVVERPMYFDYRGRGGHHWQGGHCVAGATALSTSFLFAEGTTRTGFEEWITVQNPHPYPLHVRATFMFGPGQGEPVEKAYAVAGGRRLTIFVPDETGWERDVAVELASDLPFLAERPMYFDYRGAGAGGWKGGDCAPGIASASAAWYFAEGYTGQGFHEWLCLLNPGVVDAVVEVTYLTQETGALPPRRVTVPARGRQTILVNQQVGTGYQISCRLLCISGPSLVAERAMYFSRGGQEGGHVAVGLSP